MYFSGLVFAAVLSLLLPFAASAQEFMFAAHEIRQVLMSLEDARTALADRTAEIRESVIQEPWETGAEYRLRLDKALLEGTAAERAKLNEKVTLTIPAGYSTVEAGEYRRDERGWRIILRTGLGGLFPGDEPLEVRFFHDIGASRDREGDFFRFDNTLRTGGLGAEISCTVSRTDDPREYRGEVVRIILTNRYTGEILARKDMSWLPPLRFSAVAPILTVPWRLAGRNVLGTSGPAGGIIFQDKGYYSDGWRYLEAAPEDQGLFVWWGGKGISISGTASEVGTGEANTKAIVGLLERGSNAARICHDLVFGDFDDWFLPSRDELAQMYQKKDHIGGMDSGIYWSSTEHDASGAWLQSFADGRQSRETKDFRIRVRAIRAF